MGRRFGTLLVVAGLFTAACNDDRGNGTTDGRASTTVEAGADDLVVAGEGALPAVDPERTADTAAMPSTIAEDDADGPTTACSLGNRLEDDPDVTITVWHFTDGRTEDALEFAAAEFEATHPGVTVDVVNQGGADAIVTAWRLAEPDVLPDLVLLSEDDIGALVDIGGTVPFTGCLEDDARGELLPIVEATYTIGDELVAAPYYASTPVLYYDANMFDAAGLDPTDPPTTVEELRRVSQRIVTTGAADTGLAIGLSILGGSTWYVEQWLAQLGEPSLLPDNGRTGAAMGAAWDHQVVLDQLTMLQGMVDDGLAIALDDRDDVDDLIAIGNGEAAMAVQTSGSLGDVLPILAVSYPNAELALGPLPGPGAGTLVGGAAWWMTAGRSPETTRATWELVDFLTHAEHQATLSFETGHVPVRPRALDEEPLRTALVDQPFRRVPIDQLMGSPVDVGHLVPVDPDRRRVRRLLADAIRAVFLEDAPLEPTLRAAVEDANDLLAG